MIMMDGLQKINQMMKSVLDDMAPFEGDKEVKEKKGLKILIPKKLLTRSSILLAQIKTGNRSYKLKNEIRTILSV